MDPKMSSMGSMSGMGGGGSGVVDKRAPIRVGFYDIEKTIGKGNFAVVKLARHRLTKTEVAIKIIDKTQLSAADLRRTYREVRVLKKLHHPHIIRLYQVMETKNMLYIVTEYAPQGEIFEHIAKHGRLQEAQARRLYWQVVSAVDYCHKRGVVHRDLKAENLLLDVEGSVKLADFGFSTWWSQESMLSTWCGSPPYAAPEVFEGRQYIGPEVDIWSLGVVLYVLVCGALPFDASTLPALRERVLSARYRVPYFMSADCESLVRKMLVKDPARRFSIDQVKRHRWMQADGPPRLLPAPGYTAPPPVGSSNPNNPTTLMKQMYLDPGLVPDPPTEPNEQVLRLMASLGIDSSRTRESLRQQSYDHHAAIYFLLLERLRQHRPGHRGQLVGGVGGPGHHGAIPTRMMSTDSATCRRAPRRPSTVAEHAMRKMQQVPGPDGQNQPPSSSSQQVPPNVEQVVPVYAGWKGTRPHVGPSQTSSVDEGVADMDSQWDEVMGSIASSMGGAVGGGPGYSHRSSISSGVGGGGGGGGPSSERTGSSSIRSRADWKWQARGSSGSSVQISSDMSQASGSPRESVSGSGTTLSSWDSAWEQGGNAGIAAASLPSCSGAGAGGAHHQSGGGGVGHHHHQMGGGDPGERRNSLTGEPQSPLSPGPCLTSDRLWVPATHPPGSPTEFRLGRRASDGLVGGRKLAFSNNKLEGARAGGVAALAGEAQGPSQELEGEIGCGVMGAELGGAMGLGMLGEDLVGGEHGSPIPEHSLSNLLCSPAKRPSLPDSWKLLPDNTWTTRDVWADFPGMCLRDQSSQQNPNQTGSSSSTASTSSASTSAQLHRQLMALRLQRRTGVVEPPDLNSLSEAASTAAAKMARKVLRQQSYKLAQQTPINLPPIPQTTMMMVTGVIDPTTTCTTTTSSTTTPTPTPPLLLSIGSSSSSSISACSSSQVGGAVALAEPSPIFRPIDLNAELHAHAEEEEEDEEDDVDEEDLVGSGRPWPTHQHQYHPYHPPPPSSSSAGGYQHHQQHHLHPQQDWQTLPTTMAECKLTDSNSSLRLSPLLHLHGSSGGGTTSPQPPSSPFRWVGDSHLPSQNPQQQQQQQQSHPHPGQERMDTNP